VRERRPPSSIGLSVLLPGEAQRLAVRITWGDYRLEGIEAPDRASVTSREIWKRTARNENAHLDVSKPVDQPVETEAHGIIYFTQHRSPFSRSANLSKTGRRARLDPAQQLR
jgi:hypothetical protein